MGFSPVPADEGSARIVPTLRWSGNQQSLCLEICNERRIVKVGKDHEAHLVPSRCAHKSNGLHQSGGRCFLKQGSVGFPWHPWWAAGCWGAAGLC